MATIDTTNIARDARIIVTFNDDSIMTGRFFSVNSKGLNFLVGDTKQLTSRSLNKIAKIDVMEDVATPADLFTDEGTYGAAELAAALDMDAYDLRVALRAAGYWVGKGRKYAFDLGEANAAVREVRKVLAAVKAEG